MSKDKNLIAIILAILAAALYAISTPVSKVMLQTVAPTMVAAFLYLGAGIGMGAMMLVRSGRHRYTIRCGYDCARYRGTYLDDVRSENVFCIQHLAAQQL